MFRKNARLIPTTEKGGLATPLWSDSEFKSQLGVQMNLIVTEKVRQELTQKYEIHPDKTWSVDECKKVLGACIRKNNVKGIICCHREFGLALALQQSQRNSELEEQNKELRARVSSLTKKLNRNKAAEKTDVNEASQPDLYPDLQAFFETDVAIQSVTDVPVDSVKVCGARRRSQGIEGIESVPPNSSVVQVQTVAKALGPKDIEKLSQSLPSARTNFSEFRRALISKMRLYDMSLTEVTQLMSQILTESEFNSFESAVTSELQHVSKGDLREGVLKILKNIMGPKIDWSRITNCVQRKEETVSEYTERFCQSAVTYSGIVDDSECVLDDKGPLVRIWSDGLLAEYRKALPFLDLTWSNKTLRSNLDSLATWERDADVKSKVRVAAATFSTTNQDNRWSKREGKCHYCERSGHWEKECRKKLQDSKRNTMHNSAPSQPAYNPEVVPTRYTETLGQLAQALLKSTKRTGKKLIVGAVSSYLSPVIHHNDKRIFVKGSIQEKEIDFLLDTGAEITVIPTKLAESLNIPYKKTKLCLTGVIGEDSVLYETPSIEVQLGPKTLTTKLLCAPLNTGAILGMDLLRQVHLTLDMSSESASIKISSAQVSTNNATTPKYAFLQNHPIWAKDKDDCGFLTGVEPVKLTGTPPPVTKQYPINKEAIQGIKPIIEKLLKQGVLVKTNSPCNSPIWPIKKSNGTWRLTIDYRVANKHIDKITPLVADPSTICNGLPLDCKVFSVIDMSNGFFSVPLHSDSQTWLAFTVDYEQYQWTRLPQGFQNSPTIYHQAVRRVKQSTMIQYVDDILMIF